MKLFKKVSAMVVSLLMALAVMVPVSAASRTITVTNGDGLALSYVQVIKVDRTQKTGWAFTDDEFAGYFKTAYGAENDQDAIEKYIAGGSSSTLEKVIAKVEKNATFTPFENGKSTKVLPEGLYVVKVGDTSNKYNYKPLSAAFGFDGIENTKEVTAKREENQVTKTVDDNDKAVQNGDKVTYTVKVNVPYINEADTDRTFTVTDTLTGAEYVQGTVKIDGVAAGDKATINQEAKQLVVNLNDYVADTSKAWTTVTITYDAIINTADDKVTNTATASHGSDSEYKHGEVKLYSGNITLTKYNEDESETLSGAGFNVLDKDEKVLKFVDKGNNTYVLAKNQAATEGVVTEVVTGANGQLIVRGLGLGKYEFKEVTAPSGYTINKVNAEVELTKENDTVTAVFANETSMQDTKVGSLPETGGIGTTIFTVGGCAIMVAAAALFFMNKKKHEK